MLYCWSNSVALKNLCEVPTIYLLGPFNFTFQTYPFHKHPPLQPSQKNFHGKMSFSYAKKCLNYLLLVARIQFIKFKFANYGTEANYCHFCCFIAEATRLQFFGNISECNWLEFNTRSAHSEARIKRENEQNRKYSLCLCAER